MVYIVIVGLLVCIVGLALVLFHTKGQLTAAQQFQAEKIQDAAAAQKEYDDLRSAIDKLSNQKLRLFDEIEAEKEKVNQAYRQEKQKIQEQIDLYKNQANYAADAYVDALEKHYMRAEQEHDSKIAALEEEEQKTAATLKKLKDSLSAGVRAQLREREKEDKIDFYKLTLSKQSLADVELLENIKPKLNQPVILSKLIWTTYFQKQTTEMCNRILGTKTICGIYKITDLLTKQCYIGQSVNISERWKQHIKCGLGIDAPTTNKLYNAMQKDGVWNFTFELMEECPREQLNEKEARWIGMYQSDIYGYNSTKGNKF